MQWKRVLVVVCSLCIAVIGHTASLAGTFSEELDKDSYDCSITLSPAKTLGATNTARITLEWDAARGYLQYLVTRKNITVVAILNGKKIFAKQVASGITPGKLYHLTIMRRKNSLGLVHDETLIFHAQVPHGPGSIGGITVDRGWTVNETRVQPLEPLLFTDDFMRGKDEPGLWKIQTGRWALQSAWDAIPHGNKNAFANTNFAQNPFAWVGSSSNGKPAVCTTGESFWEDYTMTVAVRPAKDGAVGFIINMPDKSQGIFARWAPVNDTGNGGNKLLVYKMVNGKRVILASSPGGYLPGQWYKLSAISTLDGLRILIDGIERAKVSDASYWRGGIGLYAEGKIPSTFDDVSVLGHTLDADILLENKQTQIKERFQEDTNGMKAWSDPRSDWYPADGIPNYYWYRRDVYGDQEWMVLTVRPTPLTTGELCMTLNGNGHDATTGYRALIVRTDKPGKLTYTLFHNDQVLATKATDLLPPNVDYTLRFCRKGAQLSLELDDEDIIIAKDTTPMAGLRPAFRANGCFANARNATIFSYHFMDYTFAEAPTDWLTAGTWAPTIRWSCSPEWSFLAGWSRGDAAMWHKDRFTGDQTFEAFLGVKMEYPRERQIYPDRYRDFCIAICGDGHEPRSGYAGIFASKQDSPQLIKLLRKGVVVASQPIPQNMIPNQGANHRSWFDLELQKTGGTVTFQVKVNGQTTSVAYTDPEPIAGGVPAIWTSDNGICISRARISFMNLPQPRNEPQVVIDDPYYPEWANLSEPMKIEFPESWSTTGKAVHLSAIPQAVPSGDESAVKANGAQVTFTPKAMGDHLYRINGIDGKNNSADFYLNVPVFDPSVGRDDSHALVLYRFNEGNGAIVHDQSPVGPPADLTISYLPGKTGQLSAQWLPRQGLTLREETSVATPNATGVDKLLAISKNRAYSAEFWISTDTIYPPSPNNLGRAWVSCLFSIDVPKSQNDSQRALSIIHGSTTLFVEPGGRQMRCDDNLSFAGFRTALMHIMVTWDGTMTRVYINGKKVGERNISWPGNFNAGNMLLLGNTADGKFPYLGTYYLFAIHDRCFTDDQVLRHYKAGPSAH